MEKQVPLCLLLRLVDDTFGREINRKMVELDLTETQFSVLTYLQQNQDHEVNPRDLERDLHLKRPTITGILQRLEQKGLLELLPSNKDGRYKQIRLTSKSKVGHRQMEEHMQRKEQVLLRDLTAQDQDELRRMLNVMIRNMHAPD